MQLQSPCASYQLTLNATAIALENVKLTAFAFIAAAYMIHDVGMQV